MYFDILYFAVNMMNSATQMSIKTNHSVVRFRIPLKSNNKSVFHLHVHVYCTYPGIISLKTVIKETIASFLVVILTSESLS